LCCWWRKARVVVLRQLGYVGDDDTVQMKGRVACEINSGNELLATEMIFAGLSVHSSTPSAVARVGCPATQLWPSTFPGMAVQRVLDRVDVWTHRQTD
jgi:superfamily II RNA helicase